MPKIVNFDMILTLEDDLTQTHGTIALPGPLQWSVTSSVWFTCMSNMIIL